MNTLALLFEFIPVVLAIVAIPNLLSTLNRGRSKKLVFPALAACILLVIAQTGWIQALLSNNTLAMSTFDKIWTIFNSLVMYTFIAWSTKTRSNKQ
jgi:uncharacterized membrane protein